MLLDVHLPDIRGGEVLARLRADEATAGLRIVMVSADATPGQVRTLRRAGADDFLPKPLDLHRLLELVDEVRSAAASR